MNAMANLYYLEDINVRVEAGKPAHSDKQYGKMEDIHFIKGVLSKNSFSETEMLKNVHNKMLPCTE